MPINIGDRAVHKETIKEEDLQLFAKVSGDHNAIHMDEEYAKKSIFKQRIAHGLLGASYISSLIANKLPGPGSIYLNQTLSFKRPVYIGDTLSVSVEIISFIKQDIVELLTLCKNQEDKIVIEGKAVVKIGEAVSWIIFTVL